VIPVILKGVAVLIMSFGGETIADIIGRVSGASGSTYCPICGVSKTYGLSYTSLSEVYMINLSTILGYWFMFRRCADPFLARIC